MKKLRLTALFVLIVFGTLMITAPYAKAQENRMKIIFMDTFYGMAAGALIASAISLTQDDPDWGENVGTGAAIGGIAGALFGLATETMYFATVENGNVNIRVPSIGLKPIGLKIDKKDGDGTIYTAGIFQYKF